MRFEPSSVPFHGGFGLLTINNIVKPNYRGMQLLHRLGGERLPVAGAHATVDAIIARAEYEVMAMLTNHAFPRHPIARESITLALLGAERPAGVWLERIDDDHCNPRRVWESLGSPEYPAPAQLRQLQDASALRREALGWTLESDAVAIAFDLPAHAVAAITLEYPG